MGAEGQWNGYVQLSITIPLPLNPNPNPNQVARLANTYKRLGCFRSDSRCDSVETVEVHHLCPRGHEILDKLP